MKINYTIRGILLFIIAIIAIYFLFIWTYSVWTTFEYDEHNKELTVDCVLLRFLTIVFWGIIISIYLGPFEGSKHLNKKRTINLNFRK